MERGGLTIKPRITKLEFYVKNIGFALEVSWAHNLFQDNETDENY